ncbi:MAG: succinate dehydrogenase assembly factor 2 [Pseudomonadota bacterium]
MSGESEQLNRLRWRCRRGMLELDYLLVAFLDNEYAQLDDRQRTAFVGLLASSDQDLHDWLVGGMEPSNPDVAVVVRLIRGQAPPKPWSSPADGGNFS